MVPELVGITGQSVAIPDIYAFYSCVLDTNTNAIQSYSTSKSAKCRPKQKNKTTTIETDLMKIL